MAARRRDKILSGPVLRLQPDQRLVALTGEGSEAAVEEIVRRYRPALVRYAASIVGSDRAEDVVQDSLAKVAPAIGAGVAELHLRPWLYTVVRNTALNALRDAGPAHEQIDENYDGVEQPPQALERREQVRSLVAGLQELPAAQREALVKREMEGRSHDEIGAALGVSPGAARQLIFRARDALRVGFGSLVPMPLLRYLTESGGGDGVVAATAVTGGGALAAKAAVAIVATGAVVGGGLAIRHAERHDRSAPPPAAAATPLVPIATGAGDAGVAREVADQQSGPGPGGSVKPAGDSGQGEGGGSLGSAGSTGRDESASSGPSAPNRHGGDGSGGRGSGHSGDDGGSAAGGGASHGGSSGRGGGSGSGDGGGQSGSGSGSLATAEPESSSSSGSGGDSSGDGDSSSPVDSSGSGSGSSGSGDDPELELSRDSGGGAGLSGVTNPQPKEEG